MHENREAASEHVQPAKNRITRFRGSQPMRGSERPSEVAHIFFWVHIGPSAPRLNTLLIGSGHDPGHAKSTQKWNYLGESS